MRVKRIAIALALLTPLLSAGDAPSGRDGQELVGTKMPALTFERWIGTEDGRAPDPAAGPVLYRWWTGGCRFCERSLPGIDALREKNAARGLRVVGVYHPKPVRKISDDAVRTAAKDMGYRGAVAVDEDWSELKRVWLDAGKRPATSVTLLVDRGGVIRFVHPGPALFPSEDPDDAPQNAAFVELDRAISGLLDAPEQE